MKNRSKEISFTFENVIFHTKKNEKPIKMCSIVKRLQQLLILENTTRLLVHSQL